MQRFGGAVIPMQQILAADKLQELQYIVGDEEILVSLPMRQPWIPFDDRVVDFLDAWSKVLLKNKDTKQYPDVVTFAFWIRKANIMALKKRFVREDIVTRIGRGMMFHIAPSNVAVNYAYSLVAGLLMGNVNVVRIPSREFPQIVVINQCLNETLERMDSKMRERICLVRYEHQSGITGELSGHTDGRIIWGGDQTIAEIQKSKLPPRAVDIAFADRYSLAIIDSEAYLKEGYPEQLARKFYNDTYLTDQNACTSPRIVVWKGDRKEEAKEKFWAGLHEILQREYRLQDKQVVDKLTNFYMLSTVGEEYHLITTEDNYITRIRIKELSDVWMQWKGNSGFFFEYDCRDWRELLPLCSNTACQTISYYGDITGLKETLLQGAKGVDRIVPVGSTMDFDLVWDGYDLYEWLTRSVMWG